MLYHQFQNLRENIQIEIDLPTVKPISTELLKTIF